MAQAEQLEAELAVHLALPQIAAHLRIGNKTTLKSAQKNPAQAEQLEAELDAAYDALELELRATPCADSQPVTKKLFFPLFFPF